MFTPVLIWGPPVGILVGGVDLVAATGISHGGENGTGRIGKDILIVILPKFNL